jgi:signal transduction histidine kinase
MSQAFAEKANRRFGHARQSPIEMAESAIMRLSHATLARLLAGVLVLTGVSLAAWLWFRGRLSNTTVPAHTYLLQPANINEWTRFGGSWEIADGAVRSNSYERGAKLLAGSSYWSNYTVNTDIWFDGPAADMGVVIRTNDESVGVDSYNGYFVGLRSLDGTLVLGRASYSWLEVLPVTMPGGIRPLTWYRLRVTAFGCNVAASVTNRTTQQTAWIAYQEHFCVKSGRFGLRTLNANAKWSNIRIEPATWNDLHDLEQHAAYVQHPIIVNGPPWWTPWHVGMLFVGALMAALLIQLAYFRFTNWKTNTINRERERLAHEIHDTMAQGFAGIGYQIQGIRTSIVRGESFDPMSIADQLHVAYQLVRTCHEEASRTIALIGQASPKIQHDLLGSLADMARKAARNKVETITELHGDPIPLNLRLADALLHIGREAIANALNHGDPTVLKIQLKFEDDSIELVVEDNGSGFNYSKKAEGFGILGMQKRARGIGSVMQISSAPGRGTQVRVKATLQDSRLLNRLGPGIRRWLKGVSAESN